jgi:transcriptional regulator with GAF, ATPase, and Fis domain
LCKNKAGCKKRGEAWWISFLELIENEFFGHEKGAFTGAHSRNFGKFEFANSGSVFLDEISNLKLELQAKLLRFLQQRDCTRIGGHRSIKVVVRMITATNISLKQNEDVGY